MLLIASSSAITPNLLCTVDRSNRLLLRGLKGSQHYVLSLTDNKEIDWF